MEHYRDEAVYESSGNFTVDWKTALRKMRQNLLQQEDCLLYIVQAAVASQATRLSVRSSATEIVIEHDGYFPSQQEVFGLPEWSVLGLGSVPRQRLGLALAASLAPPGQGMSIELAGCLSLQFGPEGLRELQPIPSQTRLIIPVNQSWWKKCIRATPNLLKRLRERARFAPLELEIDGNMVVPERLGGKALDSDWSYGNWAIGSGPGPHREINDVSYRSAHHLIELTWPQRDRHEGFSLGPSVATLRLRQNAEEEWMGKISDHPGLDFDGVEKFCAMAAVRLGPLPSCCEVIQYGVLLQPVEFDGDPQTSPWLLLADDQLATDPSCLRLVVNETLWQRFEPYTLELKRFYEQSQDAWKRTIQPDRPNYEDWVLWLVDLARSQGHRWDPHILLEQKMKSSPLRDALGYRSGA
ncbi:hypothetical protein IV102_35415 [bacterium]|nr:hypothetical protein [bacterium]